jgi:hypothetical protein
MLGAILVIIILTISYWLFLIFDYSTLLLVVFIGGFLIALFKFLSFRKYRHTNLRYKMNWEKNLTYKQHDTAPSVEEIMRVKKIAEEAERDRKLEERGD